MADALTMDQAVDVPLVEDASAGAVIPYDQQQETDSYDEGQLEAGGEGEVSGYDDSLTLDQAADIELADDDEAATGAEPIVATIEGQDLTLRQLVDGFVDGETVRAQRAFLADQYRGVQEAAGQVVGSAWVLAGLLSQQLPPRPDERLLYLNPMEYSRRKAVCDEAQAVVENALAQGEQARQSAGVLAKQRHGATIQNEYRQLVEHFPSCATDGGREAFLDDVREAVYSCGFTEDDMRLSVDHRLFRLAHLASLGLQAQERRNRPRPKKRRRHRRSEAMERLAYSGSMEDALAVDFD